VRRHAPALSRVEASVEKFDDVEDLLIGAVNGNSRTQLQEAAGIGGCDDRGAGGLRLYHFFRQQFKRRFCLRDVVDSGGATAVLRARQFHKFESGDRAQQRARGFADSLTVEKVAGILIGDTQGKRLQLGGKAEGGEKFGDVADFAGEFTGPGKLLLFGRKEIIIFLERGAASGGVGDNGVKVFEMEDGKIFSSEFAGQFTEAGVRGKRTAAELSFGHDDFAAIGSEDADGGFIEARESDVGDASSEESNAGSARAGGGVGPSVAAIEEVVVKAREKAFAFGESEKFQHADGARDGLQAGALVKAEDTREVGDEMGIGEQLPEDVVPRNTRDPGTLAVPLDARPSVLDELSVLDAGRAGGFTGAAVKAFVDVIHERIGDGKVADLDVNHLVDAAAGRIRFEIPEAVGGASVQAETTVDAAGVVLERGSGAGDGECGHGSVICAG
jgi:hypothetical protein